MREFFADFWWGFCNPGLALRGWHRDTYPGGVR